VYKNQLIELIQNQKDLSVLIVDLDGTLVDTMAVHKKGYMLLFRQHGWNFDNKIWEEKGSMGGTEWLQEILMANNVADPIKVANKLKRLKTKWFIENINQVNIINPVLDLIKWTRQNTNLKIVCATTALQEIVDKILDKYDLNGYFDLVLTAKDVPEGRLKPDPYIYNEVLKKLKVNAENSLVIEDSVVGCHSAMSANISCFNITTNIFQKPVEQSAR